MHIFQINIYKTNLYKLLEDYVHYKIDSTHGVFC